MLTRLYKKIGNSFKKHGRPSFLIIGTQKGGTTSLFNYLGNHNNIQVPPIKELHFFDKEKNYNQGIKFYERQFPACENREITGEASPYYLYHPLVAERVHSYNPQMKLIALLRNPTQRAISHHAMMVSTNLEKRSFEDCVEEELKSFQQDNFEKNQKHQYYSYVSRGMYVKQVKTWKNYFPENQILFLKSEDFFSNPKQGVFETIEFLGLSKSDFPADYEFKVFLKGKKSTGLISSEIISRLDNFYKESNSELAKIIGEKYVW